MHVDLEDIATRSLIMALVNTVSVVGWGVGSAGRDDVTIAADGVASMCAVLANSDPPRSVGWKEVQPGGPPPIDGEYGRVALRFTGEFAKALERRGISLLDASATGILAWVVGITIWRDG
jgi:hypothetical protein